MFCLWQTAGSELVLVYSALPRRQEGGMCVGRTYSGQSMVPYTQAEAVLSSKPVFLQSKFQVRQGCRVRPCPRSDRQGCRVRPCPPPPKKKSQTEGAHDPYPTTPG